MGLEPERLQVHWVSGSEAGKFVDVITQMAEAIRMLGPNRKLRDS
jgi:F420-non-reducing hydrogenase iron-sulfur subunit